MSWEILTPVVAFCGLLVTIVTLHRQNLQRMEEAAKRQVEAAKQMERLETKMEFIYRWFTRYILRTRDDDSET